MPETQDNVLMRFLNEKLVPFSTKVAQNKYIQAIGGGSMLRRLRIEENSL